jgi:hypothetical protein
MKQTQPRDASGRFLPTTSAEESKIAELEAQVAQLQTSNDWNAAESVRLAEEKRLAEQGRDAAIESRDRFQADLVAANNRERSIAAQLARSEASERKAHELLSSLTKEVDAQKAAKQLAEGRYVTLERQRAGEWLIVMAFMALAVLPAVFIAGRYWGMR